MVVEVVKKPKPHRREQFKNITEKKHGKIHRCVYCNKRYKIERFLALHWSYKHNIKQPMINQQQEQTSTEPIVPQTETVSCEKQTNDLPASTSLQKRKSAKISKNRKNKIRKKKVNRRNRKTRRFNSSYRRAILQKYCRLTLSTHLDVKTCFKKFNLMSSKRINFGRYHFFKDINKRLLAIKIISKSNCIVLKYNGKYTQRFKMLVKKRLLKRRQVKFLMKYSGFYDDQANFKVPQSIISETNSKKF